MKDVRVLMAGQFSPPITGEAVVNDVVYDCLSSSGFTVRKVNTALIKNPSDVGVFSVGKLIKSIYISMIISMGVVFSRVVYITPGQTVFGLYRFIPVFLVARFLRRSLIVHWHGYGFFRLLEYRPLLRKMIFDKNAVHLLLTNDLEQRMRSLESGCRTIVVKNFYDNKTLLAKGEKHINVIVARTPKRLQALFLGSLMVEKGVNEFLKAAEKLPEVEFVICGRGNSEIEEIVVEHSIRLQNLSYLGAVSGSVKSEVLLASDVFVLQTFYPTEGVPLSILEAMATNNAIVTTEHNGIAETVSGAATFVEAKCSHSLVSILQRFQREPELLAERKAAALARSELFKEEFFRQRILGVFEHEVASPSS